MTTAMVSRTRASKSEPPAMVPTATPVCMDNSPARPMAPTPLSRRLSRSLARRRHSSGSPLAGTFERLIQASLQVKARSTDSVPYELLPLVENRGFARLPEPCACDVFLASAATRSISIGSRRRTRSYRSTTTFTTASTTRSAPCTRSTRPPVPWRSASAARR
jgi:hypothetical protein